MALCPFVNTRCPGLLDTLIGLEESGFIPFRNQEGVLQLLSCAQPAPPLPAWLSYALRVNKHKLEQQLVQQPAGTQPVLVVSIELGPT